MKACAECARLYPDDAGFCPVDGRELVSATQAPIASADGDARIGQVMCNRYQVRRVVADGGMGRVYEALDMVDKRNVALKILHPDVATDNVSLERFKREFEVSKQLPHNHIVEVTDFQPTHDGSYALVMEFLYGEELRATLKRESVLPPERVIRMVSQIALALDEAHAKKLVHRDLKPDNVFLCQTREGDIVKILDFGSVKDKSDPAKKLTVMGTTIGSPYYMAPEQAQGLETLDHRADVWALAAISYECLVGTVPFKGNNGPSILLEILTKEPTAPSIAAQGKPNPMPPTVDRVMVHAFKKNPSMRIPSIGALADALGHAFGLEGSHREWATVPQEQLGAIVRDKLPQMMQAAGVPAPDVADNFFGESEAFGAAPGAAHPAPPGPVGQYGAYPDDLVPMGVPKSGNFGLLLAFAVGGIALLLGVVIVVVLFR
ncbi:MAG: serine/threonine protein kinase [Polyangiaceae bacterium]|nr:serine/threonine protein kinase [Polyangiaceae bacterium]MCE7892270.1 serine/threonine protein kinase [Sorangiineae bacterium PRO1]MCL4753165.1 serine/threonine protein kinase [Myxococcales bacterium]